MEMSLGKNLAIFFPADQKALLMYVPWIPPQAVKPQGFYGRFSDVA